MQNPLSPVVLGSIACISTILIGCSVTPSEAARALPEGYEKPDENLVVDCLLPGQVRQLGRRMTYQGPRRPAKLPAGECAMLGGEYVAWDRATWETSLKVWLDVAEQGDADAQAYVGEIYEKGLGREPDYAKAAIWYQRAADQDHSRAQMNLGYLYEKGLGIDQNVNKALNLYRLAAGITNDELTFTSVLERERAEASDELREMKKQASRSQYEAAALQDKLSQTQSELEAKKLELAMARRGLDEARSTQDSTELERLQGALQSRERDIEMLEQRTETERNHLAEKLANAQANERELGQELERQRVETASIRQQLEELRQKLVDTEEQLAQLNRDYEAQKAQLVMQQGVLERQRSEAPGEQTTLDMLSRRVLEQQAQLDEQRVVISRLETEREGYKQRIASLENRGQQLVMRSPDIGSASLTVPAGGHLDFGNYYALIIGNNDYQYLTGLQTPVNDAQAVERLLREGYGYKTTLLINADRAQILRTLNQYVKRLEDSDNLLIYYAGHGQMDRTNKRGYWLPVDADREDRTEWIADRAISEIINLMEAKHVLIVADSCYSGSMTRTSSARIAGASSSDMQLKRLEFLTKLPSRTVLTSGGEKPVLDAGGGSHSVFARSFLHILRNNDRILEGKVLFAEVHDMVSYAAQQLNVDQAPEYSQIADAGHRNGEFLFVPRI